MEWDDMLDSVVNGSVYFAMAGITISSSRMERGIKFSLPTYTTSIKMLTYTVENESLWSFAQGFDGMLWLYIFLTTFAIGIIIWIFEEQNWTGRKILEHGRNFAEMVLYQIYIYIYI